ncbi:MAG: hypothetical protein ACKVJ6_05135 [Flavobacteriales bacterium]
MNKYILFIAVLFAAFQSFAQDLDPTGGGLCTGLSYEVVNADPLGTGAATYRLYANLTADASEVTAMYGTDSTPWEMIATSPDGFYNDAVGPDFGGAINPLFFAAFPNLEFDSWFTIGAAPGDADCMNSAFDAALTSLADFNSGGDFVVNTFIGGSVFCCARLKCTGSACRRKSLTRTIYYSWSSSCFSQYSNSRPSSREPLR